MRKYSDLAPIACMKMEVKLNMSYIVVLKLKHWLAGSTSVFDTRRAQWVNLETFFWKKYPFEIAMNCNNVEKLQG